MADKDDVKTPEDMLAKAAEGTSEPSTDKATETIETTQAAADDKSQKPSEAVPYNRFKEVTDARAADKTAWATTETELKDQVATAQKTASELTEVVKQGQKDADLVAALRGLSQNPKYEDLIGKVDAALSGVDVEEEAEDLTPEQADDKRHTILSNVQERMQDELNEQKNEILLQRADLIAKDYLAELPEDYNTEDRNVLSEMWANRLEWQSVLETPDKMPDMLKDSLQAALKDYGEPRGKVAQTAELELENATNAPSETKELTIEEQMGKYLGKDYGKVNTVETPDGKKVSLPEVADAEFDDDFANAFKALNADARKTS